MIYLKITGRCGNQMFQYAYARYLQEKTKQKLYLDYSLIHSTQKQKPDMNFQEDLKYFQTIPYETNNTKSINKFHIKFLIYRIFGKMLPKPEKKRWKIQKFCYPLLSKLGIIFYEYGYIPLKVKNQSYYLKGYFESPLYFAEIKEILQKEFTPKFPPKEENKNLYAIIKGTQSICVTIRKFETQEISTKKLEICHPEYFYQGVKKIRKQYPDAPIIVFSDDIDWCKQHMEFEGEVYYETGNDPVWEKLRLMYSCKHFVISNSTFSWWAQYLSRNPDKMVIAPSIWRRNCQVPIDLYEKSWICIPLEDENGDL